MECCGVFYSIRVQKLLSANVLDFLLIDIKVHPISYDRNKTTHVNVYIMYLETRCYKDNFLV